MIQVARVAETCSSRPLCRKRCFGTFPYKPSFLLSQRRIEVQHERIGVPAQFGDDERHSLSHQSGDEGYVAR